MKFDNYNVFCPNDAKIRLTRPLKLDEALQNLKLFSIKKINLV